MSRYGLGAAFDVVDLRSPAGADLHDASAVGLEHDLAVAVPDLQVVPSEVVCVLAGDDIAGVGLVDVGFARADPYPGAGRVAAAANVDPRQPVTGEQPVDLVSQGRGTARAVARSSTERDPTVARPFHLAFGHADLDRAQPRGGDARIARKRRGR